MLQLGPVHFTDLSSNLTEIANISKSNYYNRTLNNLSSFHLSKRYRILSPDYDRLGHSSSSLDYSEYRGRQKCMAHFVLETSGPSVKEIWMHLLHQELNAFRHALYYF